MSVERLNGSKVAQPSLNMNQNKRINIMENFKLNTIANIETIKTSAKAKIDAICNGDANQFFDGDKLKTQTLANILLISAGASKNKFDSAKGADKYEKLYNVLSGAKDDAQTAVNAKIKDLAEKLKAKGKDNATIAELLDTTEDFISELLG